MYTQTRPLTTQPKESWIPLLTLCHTRSTGLASGGLPLPSRMNTQVSNQGHSHIPFSQSVVFVQNTLAQLSAITEQQEAEQVVNHTILTPVSPQTVAEPSPQQAFQPQLLSTLTPRESLAPDDERAQRIDEWYMRMTGRGTHMYRRRPQWPMCQGQTSWGLRFAAPTLHLNWLRIGLPQQLPTFSCSPTALAQQPCMRAPPSLCHPATCPLSPNDCGYVLCNSSTLSRGYHTTYISSFRIYS